MPKLIKNTADGWQLASADAVTEWQTPEAWQPGQALQLNGDDEPQASYAQASAIAIEFPAFTDGRGLSLAVLLRTRMGYTGELRAIGGVHEDVVHYMIRCGFDAIELGDDRDIDIALSVIEPYSAAYQASVRDPQPSFRRINRGA